MKQPKDARGLLARARRAVVKIGSRSLAKTAELIPALAEQVLELRKQDRQIVIVTSGAIALGVERLGYKGRPKEMGRLQAAAAAGQSILMRRYDEAFGRLGLIPAQVLVTHSDFADRERLNNAREAFAALLDAGAVPIVNENDTVATEEINFGDNDQLASMVTPLVGADALVLLTDVEGVLDPDGHRIPVLDEHAEVGKVERRADGVSKGGMGSKLDAARKGTRAGAAVVIASALRPRVISEVLSGADVGTLLLPNPHALRARKHWIAYTLKPRGTVLVDAGAAKALASGRTSLLPVGVVGTRGAYERGDAVRILGPDGSELGRGLAGLSSAEVARVAGVHGAELDSWIGRDAVVVHKDDLVVDG